MQSLSLAAVSITVLITAILMMSWRKEAEAEAETFAVSLSSSEKAQWKERIQTVVKQTILRGFLAMNAEKTAIYSMFDTARGKEIFLELWTGPLTGAAAKHYVEKLWASTGDWESSFLYGDGPMTYTVIDQYVRNHPMFSGDEWDKTLDVSLDSLSYLNYYYQLAIQMERKLSQVVPTNTIVAGQWRQRARYMLCALQKSTTYETFQTALVGLGFLPNYFIYTRNPFLYRRLKTIYDTYQGATALTHIENQLFIYFQWEVLVGEFESGTYGTMTATLDKLPSQCAGVSLNVPAASATTTAATTAIAATATATATGAATAATATGRTQKVFATPAELNAWAIQSPPVVYPAKSDIQMPLAAPIASIDAATVNTEAEQKQFKIVMGIFGLAVILLWVVVVFMFLAPGQATAPPQTSVQAPVLPQ
jgi:hypothetical protein